MPILGSFPIHYGNNQRLQRILFDRCFSVSGVVLTAYEHLPIRRRLMELTIVSSRR